jgi:polygalacturonase
MWYDHLTVLPTRRQFLASAAAASLGVLARPLDALQPTAVGVDPWAEVPRILARIMPPTFAERDFALTWFGAKGDGRTDCTEAFRAAIGATRRVAAVSSSPRGDSSPARSGCVAA